MKVEPTKTVPIGEQYDWTSNSSSPNSRIAGIPISLAVISRASSKAAALSSGVISPPTPALFSDIYQKYIVFTFPSKPVRFGCVHPRSWHSGSFHPNRGCSRSMVYLLDLLQRSRQKALGSQLGLGGSLRICKC